MNVWQIDSLLSAALYYANNVGGHWHRSHQHQHRVGLMMRRMMCGQSSVKDWQYDAALFCQQIQQLDWPNIIIANEGRRLANVAYTDLLCQSVIIIISQTKAIFINQYAMLKSWLYGYTIRWGATAAGVHASEIFNSSPPLNKHICLQVFLGQANAMNSASTCFEHSRPIIKKVCLPVWGSLPT